MSTSTKAGPSRSDRPILEVRQICKSFPGVRVLKSVNLSIWPGEVHAFMGENGAGKSTLMKILAGAYQPDSGEIILDDKPVHFHTPHEARLAGIGIIYQELTVAPNLTVSGNVFLGSELKRFGFIKEWIGDPGGIGPAESKIQSDPASLSSGGGRNNSRSRPTRGRDVRSLAWLVPGRRYSRERWQRRSDLSRLLDSAGFRMFIESNVGCESANRILSVW